MNSRKSISIVSYTSLKYKLDNDKSELTEKESFMALFFIGFVGMQVLNLNSNRIKSIVMKLPISSSYFDAAKNLSKNKEIVQKASDNLDLIFITENDFQGNVCFANSPEVRADFKETFTSLDLQNCIYAILHSSEYNLNDAKLPDVNLLCTLVPTDKIIFWNLVNEGRALYQFHLLEKKQKQKDKNN